MLKHISSREFLVAQWQIINCSWKYPLINLEHNAVTNMPIRCHSAWSVCWFISLSKFTMECLTSSTLYGYSSLSFLFPADKMKFGATYEEYLRAERDKFLGQCSHVEYKRLKKVLKKCRVGRSLQADGTNGDEQQEGRDESSNICECNSCTCMPIFHHRRPSSSILMCVFCVYDMEAK